MKKLKLNLAKDSLTKEQMKKISGGVEWYCYGPHEYCGSTLGSNCLAVGIDTYSGQYVEQCGYCCIA